MTRDGADGPGFLRGELPVSPIETGHLLKPMSLQMKQVFGFSSCLRYGQRAAD
jgi:hypothetical protein